MINMDHISISLAKLFYGCKKHLYYKAKYS